MKNTILILLAGCLILSCGGPKDGGDQSSNSNTSTSPKEDNDLGIGEIKTVTLNDPLKAGMVDKGQAIYDMKCAACHKTTATRVVGPGFAQITERRKPEWIMNMITNVEVMLEEDPAAREMLKECLVRMPNQNLTVGDARDVLEWLYANDGYAVE